jgi:hypothetical protein
MCNKGCILAQYSIRSKQEYIFRTNKLLEIIGASEIISNAWDILFEQAENNGIKTEKINDAGFEFEIIKDKFYNNTLNMVELFRGGGNDTVLFSDFESFRRANVAFSSYMLENYPGIIPMVVYVRKTDNYKEDYQNLMVQSEIKKNRMVPGTEYFIAPFSMMDRNTFLPYSEITKIGDSKIRLSRESAAKRAVGNESMNEKKEDSAVVKFLDNLITQKGEESLLAIVHADGNNMGSKIMNLLKDITDYDRCVDSMRKFTKNTAKAFVDTGIKALDKKREELIGDKASNENMKYFYRKIVADGDDMTFVCNARYVMDYVEAYLNSVNEFGDSKFKYSSCAGICIFHSHYPLAKAYALAEQACDSAKEKVHGQENPKEEGWFDFHYIHSGINGDLDEIREVQGTKACMARPWCVVKNKDENEAKSETDNENYMYTYEKFKALKETLKHFGVSRSNIKNLGSTIEESSARAKEELNRVYGHAPTKNENGEAITLKSKLKEIFGSEDDNTILKAIYDLSEVYDLWNGEV